MALKEWWIFMQEREPVYNVCVDFRRFDVCLLGVIGQRLSHGILRAKEAVRILER